MKKIFPVGVPVVGKDLVNRDKELQEITQLLSIGQSVIIVAPRKYGKTSLILETLNRMRKHGYFTALVDLFGILTKRQLAEKIVDSVLVNKKLNHSIKMIKENLVKAMQRVELKHTIQDFEFILGFSNYQVDEDTLLDLSLDFSEKFAQKYHKHLILAFDEFGDVFKLNGEPIIKKMRAVFQLHQNVTYIFSGSQESLMKDLFTRSKSAFFRFGRVLYLYELPKQEMTSYIITSFEKEGIRITLPVVEQILQKTNCHPYYTQLVCQLCYLNVKNVKESLCLDDILQAYRKAILFEKSYFEEIYTSLMENRYQLLLLNQLLYDDESAYKLPEIDKQYIYKLLTTLQKKGIIKRVDKGKYIITDPLFRDYLKLHNKGEI